MIVTQLTRDGGSPLVMDESMDTPGRRKEEIENEKEGKKGQVMIHGDARWVYHCLKISGLTCFVSLVSVLSVYLSNQTGQVSWGLCWVAVCVSVRLGRLTHD